MNLALFDFDGTITTVDTFTKFIFFASSKKRILKGGFVLSPYYVHYALGFSNVKFMRGKACLEAFKDTIKSEMEIKGKKYAETVIPQHIRSKALEQIKWHKQRGDTVVIVSASLDLYLQPWCTQHGLELICNKISSVNGVLTGKYQRNDCCAKEKSKRVKERFNLEEFETVYAYGDTVEDNELLALADKKYYRYFE